MNSPIIVGPPTATHFPKARSLSTLLTNSLFPRFKVLLTILSTDLLLNWRHTDPASRKRLNGFLIRDTIHDCSCRKTHSSIRIFKIYSSSGSSKYDRSDCRFLVIAEYLPISCLLTSKFYNIFEFSCSGMRISFRSAGYALNRKYPPSCSLKKDLSLTMLSND